MKRLILSNSFRRATSECRIQNGNSNILKSLLYDNSKFPINRNVSTLRTFPALRVGLNRGGWSSRPTLSTNNNKSMSLMSLRKNFYSTNNTNDTKEHNNNNNQKEKGNEKSKEKENPSWIPHRPSKEELLAAASGFLERLKIRFKWTMIRQVRPFNMDDISAMFSWVLVGNLLWILLGTTTFTSLVLLTMNTVSAQDYFARKVGDFLTKETGINVVFENAIVPHWKDGMISFRNVFVSRRPHDPNDSKKKNRVQKGSQAIAAAAAKSSSSADIDDDNSTHDEGNYTQFDLTIDCVSVTLSLRKWMDGRGVLQDVEVKGVRGVIDRRHVIWNPEDDPTQHKNVHSPGDFEIESFKLEDTLVTLHQPSADKPIDVSIFNCDLPQLRKHWLLYDILSANNVSGSYDNSLFTIHPRQLTRTFDEDDQDQLSPWKKINRLRIDSVDIKHLNRGVDGPFGWIESGDVDILADLMLPVDAEQFKFTEVMEDIVERWEANLTRHKKDGQNMVTKVEERAREKEAHKYIVIDLRVQLNNTRAGVPLFTSDLTYINNALIRPIVAYINSRDTYIPINCRVVKRLSDFEGSWTIYDSELMDDVSAEVYEAFAKNIADDQARSIRMRKVGFWSIQFAAQLLLLSLGALT